MAEYDIIAEAERLGQNLLEASFYLFRGKEGAQDLAGIRIGNIEVLRSSSVTSNLARATLEYTLMSDGETHRDDFLIKYPSPLPENLPPGFYIHRGSGYEVYRFLGGLNGVPRIISKDNLRNLCILEDVGKVTAEEKMERCEHRKDRVNLVLGICSAITDFQAEAYKKLMKSFVNGLITKSKFDRIFRERKMEERAIDYFRALRGLDSIEQLPESLRQEIVKQYSPITEAYEPRKEARCTVCHGDINLTNIVIDDKERYHPIDAKPKLREPIIDVSNLLACPGVRLTPQDWEYVAEEFMLHQAQTMKLEAGIKGRLSKIRAGWIERLLETFPISGHPEIFLGEDEKRELNNALYKLIVHYSLRRIAKDSDAKRFFPGKYEHWIRDRHLLRNSNSEMRSNISASLGILVEDAERLGIEDEEAGRIRRLKTFFENEGVLASNQKEKMASSCT